MAKPPTPEPGSPPAPTSAISNAARREWIAELLWKVGMHADLGTTYAELGDDAGLGYTMRKLIAHARAARDTFQDIKASKGQENQ